MVPCAQCGKFIPEPGWRMILPDGTHLIFCGRAHNEAWVAEHPHPAD